jgi:hypothetical protein
MKRPCPWCNAQLAMRATMKPHDYMRSESVMVRSDGELRTYSCVACGARWQRLEVNETFHGEPQFWMRLK